MEPPPLLRRRFAGVLVPLSSCVSSGGLGVGEIPDIQPLADWAHGCGLSLIQLLPIYATPEGESSPYSALTSFGLDHLYLRVSGSAETARSPSVRRLMESASFDRVARAETHASKVHHATTRGLKREALDAAFADWQAGLTRTGEREAAFAAFREGAAWWLVDHCRYHVLAALHGSGDWRQWPAAVRDRQPTALADLDRQHVAEILRHAFVQWLLDEQWRAAREHAAHKGVALMGDLPFGVAHASVDVWCHAKSFDLDREVGAPPDAFNEDGQAWGLPAPRWEAMRADGFAWWRQRVRRAFALYDALRIDHVIGLFRTWIVPEGRKGKEGRYVPEQPAEQQSLGVACLDALRAADNGGALFAEDLGWPPSFLAPSLQERGIPGYRVLRWATEPDGRALAQPASYPELSLATTGTHDTTTLAIWWDSELEPAERQDIIRRATAGTGHDTEGSGPPVTSAEPPVAGDVSADEEAPARLTSRVHRLLLGWVLGARSRAVVLPIQDVFGWKQRFNHPGTVGPLNWTWKMPVHVEHLASDRRTAALTATLAGLVRASGRTTAGPGS